MKKRGLSLFCAFLAGAMLTMGNGATITMAAENTAETPAVTEETPEASTVPESSEWEIQSNNIAGRKGRRSLPKPPLLWILTQGKYFTQKELTKSVLLPAPQKL